jgi:uncharacterized protein YecT (DUF1311 family)
MQGRLFFSACLLATSITCLTAQANKPKDDKAAQSQRHPIETRLNACTKKDPSTAGQVACTDIALREWDQELNKTYRALLAKLPNKQAETLRQSQRSWIAMRDSELKFQDQLHERLEGTMWVPVMAHARVRLTRERAEQLLRYQDWFENGGKE